MINKVHYILKSLDVPISLYDNELTELHDMISDFSECLKSTRIRNSIHDDRLSRIFFKNEENENRSLENQTHYVTG